jgi:fatty acid desaturase
MKGEGFEMARMMDNYPAARLLFPFVGWPIYLYGMPDGSHWIPYQTQRLWEKATSGEMLKCYVSTAVVIAYAVAIFELNGRDIGSMAYYYLAPLSVFGWWLVCVTYLQHHDHDTLVYDDDNWKFTDAAFETVDRQVRTCISHRIEPSLCAPSSNTSHTRFMWTSSRLAAS